CTRDRGGADAGGPDRRAAVALSARAHRPAWAASRLLRSRPRPARRHALRDGRPAGRGDLRSRRGRRRHQRACGGLVLPPCGPRKRKPVGMLVAASPGAGASKAQPAAHYEGTDAPLDGTCIEEKAAILKSISYRDYLMRICGARAEVANCFLGRTLDFYGLGI